LLSVVIIFAVLGAMKHSTMMVEGMTTEAGAEAESEAESKTKEDVPLCSNSNVPGCYSVVMDSSIWDNTEDLGDDYILKTEIVPPVCPACPSVINQHSHDVEVVNEASGEALAKPNSEYEESNITNITNQENIINQNVENVDTTVAEASTLDNELSQNQSNNNQPLQQNQKGSLQTATSGQDTITESMLSSYEKTINELRGQIKELQQTNTPRAKTENGECPPCPAPARCPEPAFSCQKVINYRSPSAGQYLPMPVLNDFSTFKDN
jgi:polyhydroxyalkanoate synthesis regulator phasin